MGWEPAAGVEPAAPRCSRTGVPQVRLALAGQT